jgi:hypothetical protein
LTVAKKHPIDNRKGSHPVVGVAGAAGNSEERRVNTFEFVVIASDRNGRIARLISLPGTHKGYGALAMGYPRLKFKKWPERNPGKVTWVGAD